MQGYVHIKEISICVASVLNYYELNKFYRFLNMDCVGKQLCVSSCAVQ